MRRQGPSDIIRSWYGLPDGWMNDGLCAGATRAEREVFFWDDSRSVPRRLAVEAQKIRCHDCPVEATCLDFAMTAGMLGVWGGTTTEDRQRMRGKGRRRPSLTAVR